MEFFRDDEKLNTLSTDDRMEVFASILPGSSDFTKEFLDEVLSNYDVGHIEIVDKSSHPFKVGDRVIWVRSYGQLLATVEVSNKKYSTDSVHIKTDCGKRGCFYPDGRYLCDDAEPSLFHA